jgi:hypothetical protein
MVRHTTARGPLPGRQSPTFMAFTSQKALGASTTDTCTHVQDGRIPDPRSARQQTAQRTEPVICSQIAKRTVISAR